MTADTASQFKPFAFDPTIRNTHARAFKAQDLTDRVTLALPRLRARAIGQRLAVRLDRKTTVSGIVTAVDFGYIHHTPRGVVAYFKVEIECFGAAKARRVVHISRLPQ